MFEWLRNAKKGLGGGQAGQRGNKGADQLADRQRTPLDHERTTFDTGAWARRSWATEAMGHVRGALSGHAKSAAPKESSFVAPKGDENQTSRYHQLVELAESGERTLPADAENYVYLNVPGLVTEHYVGYMDQNMQHLAEQGLDARMAPIDTDAGVTANAEVLRNEILAIAEETGKQVVLTGHSKGGVDIGAAMALYPELHEHVRAVVTMQSPYEGTDIADDVTGCDHLQSLTTMVLEQGWKGDRRALSDLRRGSRQRFNAQHPYASQIPTVSMLSSIDDAASPLAAGGVWLKNRHGVDSDGMVPTDSAVLPGADYVHLHGMDHAAPANYGPSGGTPGAMQEALLTLALEKAKRQDKQADAR